jgi:uncharacterized phage protein gp47/JayE
LSDILDDSGLQLKTLPELVAELNDAFRAIYGNDINLDPESPDGQALNILAQYGIDIREVLQEIYSSMDPNQAQGIVLDQRVALNGIRRRAGTFTVVPVTITFDRTVTLAGLDTFSGSIDIPAGVYTVKDDSGTQFALLASGTFAAGTQTLNFRAAELGAVEVTVGSITSPVTVIAGVTTINNLSGAIIQGQDEETDTQLLLRRERSLANIASGYLDAIEGNLLEVDGVTEVRVYENQTNIIDADDIPPHSIWAIVEGGADMNIANILYAKKTAGAEYKGDIEVEVQRTFGRTELVKFDRAISEELYVEFSIILPSGIVDFEDLKVQIVENIQWGLGADAVASTITAFLMSINSRFQITAMRVSKDDITYLEIVSPDSKAGRFVMSTDRINIT